MPTYFTWSVNMHVVYGLFSHYFLSPFSAFLTYFFPGPISIRIDVGATPPRLFFFTDHLETMRTCSTWSEDVHVVLGLSCHSFFFNYLHFFNFFFSNFFFF